MGNVFAWIWILLWSAAPIVVAIAYPETWRGEDDEDIALERVEERLETVEKRLDDLLEKDAAAEAEEK